MTLCYRRGKTIPSCGFDGTMVVVLEIEATGLVELAVTVPSPVLLVGCSPLLLFLRLTIFLMYLITWFLLSLLVILPLLNLMHTHNMRSFLK